MPHYSDIRPSPYSPAQLYAMVLDIERYPEFLPWCRGARIVERSESYFIGELIISFSHLTERYSSKVMGVPPASSSSRASPMRGDPAREAPTKKLDCHAANAPRNDEQIGRIDVTLVRGPFTHLSNHWRFVPMAQGGTEIHFEVDFKFKSALLDRLIGGLFTRAVEKMSSAFLTRADALYGKK